MMQQFHFRHGWFFAIFLFCAALVLANVIHYVIFRFIRHQETHSAGWGKGVGIATAPWQAGAPDLSADVRPFDPSGDSEPAR